MEKYPVFLDWKTECCYYHTPQTDYRLNAILIKFSGVSSHPQKKKLSHTTVG